MAMPAWSICTIWPGFRPQVPLPAAGRDSGVAGRLEGGRFGRALKAKLVEQRELVEALDGLQRKFVASRIEMIKFAVRTFDLHGAFPAFRLLDCFQALCHLKNFRAPAPSLRTAPLGGGGRSRMYLNPANI